MSLSEDEKWILVLLVPKQKRNFRERERDRQTDRETERGSICLVNYLECEVSFGNPLVIPLSLLYVLSILLLYLIALFITHVTDLHSIPLKQVIYWNANLLT